MAKEDYVRILQSDDATVTDWMRTEGDSVLRDLAAGEWTGWQRNLQFTQPIKISRRVQELAKRQLELREAASRRVRAMLARYGEVHHGTSGWWIIPCVTSAGRIGWANSAKGRAYLSSEVLPNDERQAVTMPGQPSRAIHGGTTMHDAAVSGSALVELPDGWVQLCVDVRGGEAVKDPEEPVLVAYGLQTCYGHRGGRPYSFARCCEDVDEDIAAAVSDQAKQLVDAVAEALEAVEIVREDRLPWPLWSDVCASFEHAIQWSVLVDCGLSQLCSAADQHDYLLGDRRGRLAEALRRIVTSRMWPILAAAPEISPTEDTDGQAAVTRYRHWVPVMQAIMKDVLAPHRDDIQTALKECEAILYRDGAVVAPPGQDAGVTCTSTPAKPQARIYERDGIRLAHVPAGAEVPEGFPYCVQMGVNYSIYAEQEIDIQSVLLPSNQ